VMVLLAATPLQGEEDTEGILYGGFVLNGSKQFIKKVIESVVVDAVSSEKLLTVVTIFQDGTRIATTLDQAMEDAERNAPILSVADDKITEAVLRLGRDYVGLADVAGEDCYTAYKPIRDFAGRIIGMLGIGTPVYEYKEAQSRTIALFSSLIAGGMIFGFIMTYLFSVWLMRPIQYLAKGMSRVAKGDLNYKVRLKSQDELGMLARSFNRMVRAVKERDIQMREMTDHRLSEVEKQISIGRLAAGVAHEINNPLTAILSLSSLMLRHTPEGDPKREDLDVIVAETTRCRKIVSSLLDFARERQPEKKLIDVNQVVRDTLTLAVKYDSLQDIKVETSYFDHHLLVFGDPRQLQQVFTNLILNAAEAIKETEEDEKSRSGGIKVSVDDDSSG